jgi:hypothetical protein
MRTGIGLVLACCVLATTPTKAAQSADQVLNDCEAYLRSYKRTGPETVEYVGIEAGRCFGYMAAVGDLAGLSFSDTSGVVRKAIEFICPPQQGQTTQLIRVFVNFGHQHPERLNQPSLAVVLEALGQAFPCKH